MNSVLLLVYLGYFLTVIRADLSNLNIDVWNSNVKSNPKSKLKNKSGSDSENNKIVFDRILKSPNPNLTPRFPWEITGNGRTFPKRYRDNENNIIGERHAVLVPLSYSIWGWVNDFLRRIAPGKIHHNENNGFLKEQLAKMDLPTWLSTELNMSKRKGFSLGGNPDIVEDNGKDGKDDNDDAMSDVMLEMEMELNIPPIQPKYDTSGKRHKTNPLFSLIDRLVSPSWKSRQSNPYPHPHPYDDNGKTPPLMIDEKLSHETDDRLGQQQPREHHKNLLLHLQPPRNEQRKQQYLHSSDSDGLDAHLPEEMKRLTLNSPETVEETHQDQTEQKDLESRRKDIISSSQLNNESLDAQVASEKIVEKVGDFMADLDPVAKLENDIQNNRNSLTGIPSSTVKNDSLGDSQKKEFEDDKILSDLIDEFQISNNGELIENVVKESQQQDEHAVSFEHKKGNLDIDENLSSRETEKPGNIPIYSITKQVHNEPRVEDESREIKSGYLPIIMESPHLMRTKVTPKRTMSTQEHLLKTAHKIGQDNNNHNKNVKLTAAAESNSNDNDQIKVGYERITKDGRLNQSRDKKLNSKDDIMVYHILRRRNRRKTENIQNEIVPSEYKNGGDLVMKDSTKRQQIQKHRSSKKASANPEKQKQIENHRNAEEINNGDSDSRMKNKAFTSLRSEMINNPKPIFRSMKTNPSSKERSGFKKQLGDGDVRGGLVDSSRKMKEHSGKSSSPSSPSPTMSKIKPVKATRKDARGKWIGVFAFGEAEPNKTISSSESAKRKFHQGAIGLVILGLMLCLVLSVACSVTCASVSNPSVRRVNSRTAIYSPNDYYDDNTNKGTNFAFLE